MTQESSNGIKEQLRRLDRTSAIPIGLELRALSTLERLIFLCLSLATILFVIWDVSADIAQGSSVGHIVVDIFFGCAAITAFFLLAARMGRQRLLSSEAMADTVREKDLVSKKASQWESKANQLLEGISQEIDDRMTQWKLSAAEKEIGLLLLKGLSLREIAELRGTSERTVRQQSLGIYGKADVAGRAELSAFFIEDFLDRKSQSQNSSPARTLDH